MCLKDTQIKAETMPYWSRPGWCVFFSLISSRIIQTLVLNLTFYYTLSRCRHCIRFLSGSTQLLLFFWEIVSKSLRSHGTAPYITCTSHQLAPLYMRNHKSVFPNHTIHKNLKICIPILPASSHDMHSSTPLTICTSKPFTLKQTARTSKRRDEILMPVAAAGSDDVIHWSMHRRLVLLEWTNCELGDRFTQTLRHNLTALVRRTRAQFCLEPNCHGQV
jgi:hypothetical protein